MDIKDIQQEDKRDKVISVRTTTKDFKWIKKNKLSPTKIFNKALEETKLVIKNAT